MIRLFVENMERTWRGLTIAVALKNTLVRMLQRHGEYLSVCLSFCLSVCLLASPFGDLNYFLSVFDFCKTNYQKSTNHISFNYPPTNRTEIFCCVFPTGIFFFSRNFQTTWLYNFLCGSKRY